MDCRDKRVAFTDALFSRKFYIMRVLFLATKEGYCAT
jgi:hypothetical protein